MSSNCFNNITAPINFSYLFSYFSSNFLNPLGIICTEGKKNNSNDDDNNDLWRLKCVNAVGIIFKASVFKVVRRTVTSSPRCYWVVLGRRKVQTVRRLWSHQSTTMRSCRCQRLSQPRPWTDWLSDSVCRVTWRVRRVLVSWVRTVSSVDSLCSGPTVDVFTPATTCTYFSTNRVK